MLRGSTQIDNGASLDRDQIVDPSGSQGSQDRCGEASCNIRRGDGASEVHCNGARNAGAGAVGELECHQVASRIANDDGASNQSDRPRHLQNGRTSGADGQWQGACHQRIIIIPGGASIRLSIRIGIDPLTEDQQRLIFWQNRMT